MNCMKNTARAFSFLLLMLILPAGKPASAQAIDSAASPCNGRGIGTLQPINPAPYSIAIQYGLHSFNSDALQVVSWFGVELAKDWNLALAKDKHPLLNLNTSIGFGMPYALLQASLRYFPWKSSYLFGGFKYHREADYVSYAGWGTHTYRVVHDQFFQNVFATIGYGTHGIDRYYEFAVHYCLQASVLDTKEKVLYGMVPGPPYGTTKSHYFSISFRIGFDQ